jgi:hypothetical protein
MPAPPLAYEDAVGAELARASVRVERRQGATVLGVTYLGDAASAERSVRAEHITYPVLRDATRRLATASMLDGSCRRSPGRATRRPDKRGTRVGSSCVMDRVVADMW